MEKKGLYLSILYYFLKVWLFFLHIKILPDLGKLN